MKASSKAFKICGAPCPALCLGAVSSIPLVTWFPSPTRYLKIIPFTLGVDSLKYIGTLFNGRFGKQHVCHWFIGERKTYVNWTLNIVILQFSWSFRLEWVLYDFQLVVLHTISIISFHLWWYMLGGSVWIQTRGSLFCEVHWRPNSF